MLRLGSNDPCGLVSCTRYGDVDEVSEALGPVWSRLSRESESLKLVLICSVRLSPWLSLYGVGFPC